MSSKFSLLGERIKTILSLDVHMTEVLLGAWLAFSIRAVGAVLALLLNITIGRLLGAEGAGLYFLALSVTSISAVIAKLGLDNSMLRFIAISSSKQDWRLAKGTFKFGIRLAGFTSFSLSLAVFLMASWIANDIFGEPDLIAYLRWMSLGVFCFSMMSLISESLKGIRYIRDAMLVSGVIFPTVALVLIWPLVQLIGYAGPALAYVLGTGTAALVGWRMWQRATKNWPNSIAQVDRATLWSSMYPLWITSIINQAVLPWAPLFFLGIWGTTQEIGIFGAATRVALLVAFFLTAVNTVIIPKFAEMHSREDVQAMGRLAQRFAVFIALVASPFCLFLVFNGDWVMTLFGPEFSHGGAALAILALGQLVNAMTGLAGHLLIMTGHERDTRNASIFAMLLMLVSAILLIPPHGMLGASIASALALAGMNLFSTVFVWLRHDIFLLAWKAK